MKSITVQAVVENLEQINDFINAELENINCDMTTQTQIDMAVEEIYVNISNYAYENSVGDAEVRCDIVEEPFSVVIQFLDKGVPFNPLQKEDVDISPDALLGRIGGLGIHMVKNIMDEIDYSYENGKNILTLKKYMKRS